MNNAESYVCCLAFQTASEAMRAFVIHQNTHAFWADDPNAVLPNKDQEEEAIKWCDVVSLWCQTDGSSDGEASLSMQIHTLGRVGIDRVGDREQYFVTLSDGSEYQLTPDQVAGSIEDMKKHGPLPLDRGVSNSNDIRCDDVPGLVAEIASKRSVEDEKQLREAIRRRNGRLDAGQYMRLPKELAQLHAAALTQQSTRANKIEAWKSGVRTIKRVEVRDGTKTKITGHRITVTLDPQTRQTVSTARASRIKRPHAILEYDQQSGKPEDLVPMALETLSFFDTDTLQTANVLFDMADSRGILHLSVPKIAKGRGAPLPLSKKTRDRFNAQIDLLKEVMFHVHRYSKRGKELPTGRIPLINPLIDYIDPDTGERVDGVYQINPILWDDMNKGGRFLLLDRRVAQLNSKNDEWIIRLHWYFAARWANQKPTDLTSGVPQPIAVETMLNGAGIEYRKQLAAQGQPWLEDRVNRSLKQMEASDLIGHYTFRKKAGKSFLDASVTIRPTTGLLNQMEYRRSTLLSVTRQALEDGTTQTQIKQKAEK